jgi:hypothetical protein
MADLPKYKHFSELEVVPIPNRPQEDLEVVPTPFCTQVESWLQYRDSKADVRGMNSTALQKGVFGSDVGSGLGCWWFLLF